jgi:hypothetical protein
MIMAAFYISALMYNLKGWKQPNYPESRTFPESIALSERDYDLLEGVQDVPVCTIHL